MQKNDAAIESRLKYLEKHLAQENPVLLNAVQSFRELDQVAYKMHLLDPSESFATAIPWWPMISILGTFSSGKSTFINDYLGMKLQRTGNQAVDDRFTVICYSEDPEPHTLPGVSLNSDPRFPFYKISREIEAVAAGEGNRIDAYLQLKSCNSPQIEGKILIDSPGFDADRQRTATLRITDHMVDLSDLVLVFFDARRPEPGAMRDTLKHLVEDTIQRDDSGKFLYILNQLDTTAREDNPEEVIAAWQRALGEHGLTAGRFYTIFSPSAALIEDEELRQRYEAKRDRDLAEIYERMGDVKTERAYRIVGTLEKTSREIEGKVVPILQEARNRWKKRTLIIDAIVFGTLGLLIAGSVSGQQNHWLDQLWAWMNQSATQMGIGIAGALLTIFIIHHIVRSISAKSLFPWLRRQQQELSSRMDLVRAFKHNVSFWKPLAGNNPAGWTSRTKQMLQAIVHQADGYVQELNNRFANPSGDDQKQSKPTASPMTIPVNEEKEEDKKD